MENNIINFFWSGDNWTYLHDLTIKSHIVVGHIPKIWLHGDKPKSRFWDDFVMSNRCDICDANDIFDVSRFLKNGGNFKTGSSLWRFKLLYEYGGWYSDTDAIAMNEWPKDDIVICKNYNNMYSTGVMKFPPNNPMFIDMMENIKLTWGNVKVFNEYCNIKQPTFEKYQFFPFTWENWKILLNNYDMKYENIYSIHLYHTMFERSNMIDNIDIWTNNNKNSLLSVIDQKVKSKL